MLRLPARGTLRGARACQAGGTLSAPLLPRIRAWGARVGPQLHSAQPPTRGRQAQQEGSSLATRPLPPPATDCPQTPMRPADRMRRGCPCPGHQRNGPMPFTWLQCARGAVPSSARVPGPAARWLCEGEPRSPRRRPSAGACGRAAWCPPPPWCLAPAPARRSWSEAGGEGRLCRLRAASLPRTASQVPSRGPRGVSRPEREGGAFRAWARTRAWEIPHRPAARLPRQPLPAGQPSAPTAARRPRALVGAVSSPPAPAAPRCVDVTARSSPFLAEQCRGWHQGRPCQGTDAAGPLAVAGTTWPAAKASAPGVRGCGRRCAKCSRAVPAPSPGSPRVVSPAPPAPEPRGWERGLVVPPSGHRGAQPPRT